MDSAAGMQSHAGRDDGAVGLLRFGVDVMAAWLWFAAKMMRWFSTPFSGMRLTFAKLVPACFALVILSALMGPIWADAASLFPAKVFTAGMPPTSVTSAEINGDGHTNRLIEAFGKLPLAYGESGMFQGIFITLFNTAGAMLVISKAQ